MKTEDSYFFVSDTLRSRNLLNSVRDNFSGPGLNVGRNTIREENLSIEKLTKRPEVVEKPTKSVYSQIRYWEWKKDQQMLVDSSRYIMPISQVKITPLVAIDDKSLILPAYHRNIVNTDWLTLILILVLILFASVQHSFSKYLGQLYQSVFNISVAGRMYREKNNSSMQGAFILEITFYLVFSILVYHAFVFYGLFSNWGNLSRYATSLLLVTGFYVVKKNTYRVIGYIFETEKLTSEYLFHHDNFNRILGLALFPIVSFLTFYTAVKPNVPLMIGFTLTMLFYLMILQRGISILSKKQFSVFYLFLYLCTLEFLPLLLLIGLIASQ